LKRNVHRGRRRQGPCSGQTFTTLGGPL
jgi:hypothetical protein